MVAMGTVRQTFVKLHLNFRGASGSIPSGVRFDMHIFGTAPNWFGIGN